MKKKYHFIAIGGVGMSGLAKYLLQNGYEVSGSDIYDSKYVKSVLYFNEADGKKRLIELILAKCIDVRKIDAIIQGWLL